MENKIISTKSYFILKNHSPVYKTFKNYIKDKDKKGKTFMNLTLKNFSKLKKYKSNRNYSKNKNPKNFKIQILHSEKSRNNFDRKCSINSKSNNRILYHKNKENWTHFDKITNKIPLIKKSETKIKKKNLLLQKLKKRKHFKNIKKNPKKKKQKKNILKTFDGKNKLQNFNEYLEKEKNRYLIKKSKKKLFNDSCLNFSWSNYNKFCINHPHYKLFDVPDEVIKKNIKEKKLKKKNQKRQIYFFLIKKKNFL